MAATSQESGLDVNIPQWKKELILRKRAGAVGGTLQSSGFTRSNIVLSRGVRGGRQVQVNDSSGSLIGDANAVPLSHCINLTCGVGSVASHRKIFSNFNEVTKDTMRFLDQRGDIMVNRNSGVINDSVRCDLICIGSERKFRNSNGSVSPKLKTVRRPSMLRSRSVCSGSDLKSSVDNEDSNSDSSEEFQYGPGIVSKLKTKYLSMTLRENQKRGVRPSLSNLRRAASLENMLDEEAPSSNTVQKPVYFNKYVKKNCSRKSHFMSGLSSTGKNEVMKRAQSMETLVQSEVSSTCDSNVKKKTAIPNDKCLESISKKDIVILENMSGSKECSDNLSFESTELPPPDVVKQTVKLFEPSSAKPARLKLNKPVRLDESLDLSKNSSLGVNKPICKIEKPVALTKPHLSPKPSPEKLQQNRLNQLNVAAKSVSTKPSNYVSSNIHTSTLKFITTNSPSLKSNLKSPVSMPETNELLPVSNLLKSEPNDQERTEDTLESESTDGQCPSKQISKHALENIRKGGTSMQFNFESSNDIERENIKTKSHLPTASQQQPLKLVQTSHIPSKQTSSSSPVISSKPVIELAAETKINPASATPVTHMKQVGVIRPIVSSRQQLSLSNNMQQSNLTSQEKEKNLINQIKSIEQPVSKVVVAIKTLPDHVVGSVPMDISLHTRGFNSVNSESAENDYKSGSLWDKKPWHHQQNTVVFNFSDRKDVPDYIENDGLIMRSTRDRPRLGDTGSETGIIYLGRTRGGDESSTDNENEFEDLSPNDIESDPTTDVSVTFIGDNVLINGKSNLKKQAKREKLRIQFKDETTTYEYLSESSYLEDTTPTSNISPSPIPSVLGSVGNLSSYTPSKAQLGNQEFQLGVTRVSSNSHSNTLTSSTQAEPAQTTDCEYLKPAEDGETLTWSKEQSSDLLF